MPGNVAAAQPSGVLPRILASAYTVELRLEMLANSYPDGSSERQALALNPRHYFHLTQPLTGAAWAALWSFFLAHKGVPFYIYNPRETVPPFSYDPTGNDSLGRYTVVFDGGWSETTSMARAQIGFSLREVV
jgi:hypothetical protein